MHVPINPSGEGAATATALPTRWQAMPEIPTSAEVMTSDSADLPVMPLDSPDRETYLESHFKLLRYEGVEPLRQAIKEVQRHPSGGDGMDFFIYEKVIRSSQ
jgi:helicase required for RNAi-mediated heterochromatin assembly 1